MGRNGIKLAATIFVAALACAGYAAGSRAAARRNAAANGSVDAGAVYSRHCMSCHGEDGRADTEKGQMYGATDFTSKKWWDKQRPTDARLRRAISAGKRGGMPAFRKKLSAAEISELATYVRGFKGR